MYKITLAEVEDFLARVADGNYQETGLRPRKLKQGPAQRKLFAERLLTERLRKWGVDETNDRARPIKESFIKLSRRLLEGTLEKALEVAESIASAEQAKNAWNPKGDRKRYARISRVAVGAAALAKQIGAMWPPPWEENCARIGELVTALNAGCLVIVNACQH